MSTNYTPMARNDRLVKLRDKIRDGRKVVREERSRWAENRAMYRGEQWIRVNPSAAEVERIGSNTIARASLDFNAYNRLRQFTDGRTALLTKDRPPYDVAPEDLDQDSIDGAKQAEKLVGANWGAQGWGIKGHLSELVRNGDIDGPAWLSVSWDSRAGDSRNTMIAVTADGQPVTDRATYEALKEQDPEMRSAWRMEHASEPQGDIRWRVVLPGAMSVDPFAVKNHRDAEWICESRIRPRKEVEERMGVDYKQAVKESRESQSAGQGSGAYAYEDLAVDDRGAGASINERDGVIVHYFYIKPCKDYPKGLHAEFADKVPERPLLMEDWEDELPYFCYTPRPDPGHFLRSRGIVDDLKPIQRDYNQTVRHLREWLRRAAQNPWAFPFGSLASDSVYSEDGYFFYHPAMGEPHQSNTSSEPSVFLSNELARIVGEMREISGISASAQGLRAPGGPESAAGINVEVQQTEQNLSETEARFVEAIEWGVSRTLKLVGKHYTTARTVVMPGVDNDAQFKAFHGALLRGAHRFRVTGPVMPKSKAARMQALFQFAPFLQDKLGSYVHQFIDGDLDEFTRDIEIDRQHQKTEIRELVGLVNNELAMEVYKRFEQDKQAFAKAVNMAQQMGADAMAVLAQQGIQPPMLTEALRSAGFDLPDVEEDDDHAIELAELKRYRKGDGYRKLHPMVKQLINEHRQKHAAAFARQLGAMAQQVPVGQQQGSDPNPRGTPSPPKNPQTTGAM